MNLTFDGTFNYTLDGIALPDFDAYTKEELAGEIVRQRRQINELVKENDRLNVTLKENAICFKETLEIYLERIKWERLPKRAKKRVPEPTLTAGYIGMQW